MGSCCSPKKDPTAPARPPGPMVRRPTPLNPGVRVRLDSICGRTVEGVPAYSNWTHNTFTNKQHYEDGLFMGYQWQCVEFARRWLWKTKGLLLPKAACAYCFTGLTAVKRPVGIKPTPYITKDAAGDASDMDGVVYRDYEEQPRRRRDVTYEDVPCVFVRQGTTTPPTAKSLIVYPMSWGSPYGHIGVIVDVNLAEGWVAVADQNRYFTDWGGQPYGVRFRLDVEKGCYYIRDNESECTGWITFPGH